VRRLRPRTPPRSTRWSPAGRGRRNLRRRTWPPSSTRPRAIWLMVPRGGVTGARRRRHRRRTSPAGRHDHRRRQLALRRRHRAGRSHWRRIGNRLRRLRGRAAACFGLERGFCLMIGGPTAARSAARPDLPALLAPGRGLHRAHVRGEPVIRETEEMGYLHCGPAGAGSLREDGAQTGSSTRSWPRTPKGSRSCHHANVGAARPAGPTPRPRPLAHPELYQYDLDIPKVAEVWRRGKRRRVVAARPDRETRCTSRRS